MTENERFKKPNCEHFFFFTDSTKVEYIFYCPNHSTYTYNELVKLLEILKSFTGAKDGDIMVSAVKEGCIHVTLMIRNHLISQMRSLYSPKNLQKTCQRMSKSLQHRIIKVLIEDVAVYTSGMFKVKIHLFFRFDNDIIKSFELKANNKLAKIRQSHI